MFCEIIVEHKTNGNYVNGNMVNRAYPLVAQQYLARKNLRHDTLQLRNRLGQLKSMYSFIRALRNKTEIRRRPDGWPDATPAWWENQTHVSFAYAIITYKFIHFMQN